MLQSTHKTQFLQFFLIFSFAVISLSDPAIVTDNCVHIYSRAPLFRTRLVRSPAISNSSFFPVHLKSTPLFRTFQKQSTWGSVKQSILSHATVCAEIRQRQASCHTRSTFKPILKSTGKKKTKTTEYSKIFTMQQHVLFYPTYNYSVFLSNQCLSSYCTVFY